MNIMLTKGFKGILNGFTFFFINSIDTQKTRAILEILEPIPFPNANIVLFCSADSIDINISGADVAMPIMKKLAKKPEIEK